MLHLFSGLLAFLAFACFSRAADDDDYGVAIRYTNTTCPSGTFWIGTSLVPNCCPDGMYGAPKGSSYCCPSEDDCGTDVEENIRCANTSWTYFPSPDNQPVGFCCLPDWVGYVQLNSSGDQLGVACETPGYELDTLQSTVPSIKLGSQATSTTSSSASVAIVTATATSSGETVTITSTSGAASSTPIALDEPTEPPGSESLRIGSIVGITLGVLAVVAGLAFFYWRWKKKHGAAATAAARSGDGVPQTHPELAGYYKPGPDTKQNTPYEMLASSVPQEMDSGVRHELPTEWYGHEADGLSSVAKASRGSGTLV